jgi:hypothetical protein
MSSNNGLLINVLRALVQEWGHREVEFALAHLSDAASDAPPLKTEGPERTPRKRSGTKLLATEQVARAHLPRGKEGALRELAMRYDGKQFLPTIPDVREFLVMMGERPRVMKDRSDAFRQLLIILSGLPPERLERLVNSARHSGPSQLGPLSDAISAAAESLPRHREPAG